jgi:hypothetical protein
VYLLEGLNPEYIGILGHELRVDPEIFSSHERSSIYLRLPHEISLAPRLPSLLKNAPSFTASYYDPRAVEQPLESFTISCGESGRDALTTRLKGEWERVVILNQKCSIWENSSKDLNNWNSKDIILSFMRKKLLTLRSLDTLRPAIPESPNLVPVLSFRPLAD